MPTMSLQDGFTASFAEGDLPRLRYLLTLELFLRKM